MSQLRHYSSSASIITMVKEEEERPTRTTAEDDLMDDRPSTASKRRPSRAGLRSVTTLSTAQLERKRANDREAQRAIRARTKDHIEQLTSQVNAANMRADHNERLLLQAQQRNRHLEDELTFIKTRASAANESFIVGIPTNEVRSVDSAISLSSDASGNVDAQYPPALETQQVLMTTSQRNSLSSAKTTQSTGSQQETWSTQQRGYTASPAINPGPPGSATIPRASTSWRAAHDGTETLQQLMATGAHLNHHLDATPRPLTASMNATHHTQQQQWQGDGTYNFMLDNTQQSQPPATPQRKQSQPQLGQQQRQTLRHSQQTFQERAVTQFATQNGEIATQPQSYQSGAYTPAMATPSLDFQNLSMHSPANVGTAMPRPGNSTHEQHALQSAYTVSSGPPSADFQHNDIQQSQNYNPATTVGGFAQQSNQTTTTNDLSHIPLDFGTGESNHQQHQHQSSPHQNYDFGTFYATTSQ